jgi:hypothetical protein
MAKRPDRLKPIHHNIGQIENLKTLEPIATPAEVKPLSDALVDLAIAALEEVAWLEEGNPPSSDRLQELVKKAESLQQTK